MKILAFVTLLFLISCAKEAPIELPKSRIQTITLTPEQLEQIKTAPVVPDWKVPPVKKMPRW